LQHGRCNIDIATSTLETNQRCGIGVATWLALLGLLYWACFTGLALLGLLYWAGFTGRALLGGLYWAALLGLA
jgi:hypothetical protein